MITEIIVELEIVDDRIFRLGVKPSQHAPWVLVMILEAVIGQLKLVIEADYARRTVNVGPRLNLGDLHV